MSRPLPSSSQPLLREKQALFDDWGLSDDGDSGVLAASAADSVMKKEDDSQDGRGVDDFKPEPGPKLSDAERMHRRKSRAFAVAAKAAALEAEAHRERKDRERQQKQQRPEERPEQRRRRSDVIDLIRSKETSVPPPRMPRRAHSALEFVRTSATLRRTSSTPLSTLSTRQAKKQNVEDTLLAASVTATTVRHIFSGLAFYYLPDAALGARKLRIAKAQQHGATWVRRIEDATHVIVDKPLRWTEIARAVHGRRPEAIVVYDEYPLDCIGFRCLLNPAQRRYHISGRDDAERPATSEDGGNESLSPIQPRRPVGQRRALH